jgi:two-component system sensor histidine kinase TctE
MNRSYSLKQRLLIRLWIPLAAVLLAGAVLSFSVADHFGNVVHDRWLLDSAMTLATQVRVDAGHLKLDLAAPAQEMFEWDSMDNIYEEALSPDGRRLFGNAEFPKPPASLELNVPSYYDATIAGNDVRVVAVAIPSPIDATRPVIVQVAETKKKRQALVWEITLVLVPLQFVILFAAGAFVWFAVKSSLSNLDQIAVRLGGYEPDSLRPLEEVERAPVEVRPLVLAINRLIGRLIEVRGTQQRFVANAAHQLRTPLAALQVQTERALREPNPDAHGEALSHVLKAVSRLRRLTHQLLTLTRSDASAPNMLALGDIDIAELARDELGKWADAAVARNIDLGYDGPDSGTKVHGEEQLLRELIGNLIDNAIRYGSAGGEVTLGVRPNPTIIFVEDDGPGIAETERVRVQEPFYRSPNSGANGSGLGLAIAREIAVRHGARLDISDHVPHGTRIEVVFAAT